MIRVSFREFLAFFIITSFAIAIIHPTTAQTTFTLNHSMDFNSIQQTTTLTVLVVLMELSDDPHHISHSVEHYNDLFFAEFIRISSN